MGTAIAILSLVVLAITLIVVIVDPRGVQKKAAEKLIGFTFLAQIVLSIIYLAGVR